PPGLRRCDPRKSARPDTRLSVNVTMAMPRGGFLLNSTLIQSLRSPRRSSPAGGRPAHPGTATGLLRGPCRAPPVVLGPGIRRPAERAGPRVRREEGDDPPRRGPACPKCPEDREHARGEAR